MNVGGGQLTRETVVYWVEESATCWRPHGLYEGISVLHFG